MTSPRVPSPIALVIDECPALLPGLDGTVHIGTLLLTGRRGLLDLITDLHNAMTGAPTGTTVDTEVTR